MEVMTLAPGFQKSMCSLLCLVNSGCLVIISVKSPTLKADVVMLDNNQKHTHTQKQASNK